MPEEDLVRIVHSVDWGEGRARVRPVLLMRHRGLAIPLATITFLTIHRIFDTHLDRTRLVEHRELSSLHVAIRQIRSIHRVPCLNCRTLYVTPSIVVTCSNIDPKHPISAIFQALHKDHHK